VIFAYNKLHVQLSGLTEWLVSNIATRILIRTYKFWTATKTLTPLRIFVSPNPWHHFVEPSLRNTSNAMSTSRRLWKTFPLMFHDTTNVQFRGSTSLCLEVCFCSLLLTSSHFLGAFAKLRKATIRFVMSGSLDGTTRLSLDGLL
jgi:hypothetical protein